MRKKTRESILALLDEAFRTADMPVDLEFTNLALRILRKYRAPRNDLTAIIVGGVRAGVARALDDAEEPTADGLKQIFSEMKAIPYAIRKPATKAFRGAVKELPHPPGGRPRSLSDEKNHEVIDAVAELNRSGVKLQVAFGRVALRLGVSSRTVQRVWQDRQNYFPGG
ncbi:MAG: hypothetical protein LAP21_28710 [Acidobacteriia bacterium]|nr:hypothetical protein [Terriglobia bacterium]